MSSFTLTVKTSKGNDSEVNLETLPDTCPCCHKGIDPKYKIGFIHDNDYPTVRNVYVQAVFQCPRRECFRFFIADYTKYNEGSRGLGTHRKCELVNLSPYWYEEEVFPPIIKELSPSFYKIYNEAAEAESLKLLNVAGPGYRKALEFLVKDYVCGEEPQNVDSIKKMALQNVIQNKIQDANLKACAELATWLGNDETHYIRIWVDQDINDEKRLIKLCVNWIESHLLTKEYMKEMQTDKK